MRFAGGICWELPHWKGKPDKNNEALKLFPQRSVLWFRRRLSVMYYVTSEERAKKYCAFENRSEESRKKSPDVYMTFEEEKVYRHFI